MAMTRLTCCRDPAAADWLLQSGTPPEQLITFGPSGFEAYARLRFIPDRLSPNQAHHEYGYDLPQDHPSDIAQTRRALHLLAQFTSTPQECYFCVWEGYSDITLPTEAARVELPYRSYVLLRGAVTDIDAWETDLGHGCAIAPPAFVWPLDHRWCFTSDVDPTWAGIGGDHATIRSLLADQQLDVVPAYPAETYGTDL